MTAAATILLKIANGEAITVAEYAIAHNAALTALLRAESQRLPSMPYIPPTKRTRFRCGCLRAETAEASTRKNGKTEFRCKVHRRANEYRRAGRTRKTCDCGAWLVNGTCPPCDSLERGGGR